MYDDHSMLFLDTNETNAMTQVHMTFEQLGCFDPRTKRCYRRDSRQSFSTLPVITAREQHNLHPPQEPQEPRQKRSHLEAPARVFGRTKCTGHKGGISSSLSSFY
jgi:hypothetical protein